jgi:hypothetical protein
MSSEIIKAYKFRVGAPGRGKGCECLKRANEELGKRNTRVAEMFGIFTGVIYIPIKTEKIDSKERGGPVGMAATYCPWCGRLLP